MRDKGFKIFLPKKIKLLSLVLVIVLGVLVVLAANVLNLKKTLFGLSFASNVPLSSLNSPQMIYPNLGDADVLKLSDNDFLVAGSTLKDQEGKIERSITILETSNFQTFEPLSVYSPSQKDSKYDYCFVWAPAIEKVGSVYSLYFSAVKVKDGETCSTEFNQEMDDKTAIYHTEANQITNFGSPEAYVPENLKTADSEPQTGSGVLKIDPDFYGDNFFYVWRQVLSSGERRNNISSVDITTGKISDHVFAKDGEWITEGPAPAIINGKSFLFYQARIWATNYSIKYKTGSSFNEITDSSQVRELAPAVILPECTSLSSTELDKRNDCYHRNFGISSIFSVGNKYYVVYHVGYPRSPFPDRYYARDTWIAPLALDSQGYPISLVETEIKYPEISEGEYSFDVQKNDGDWVEPCVAGYRVPLSGSFIFNGACEGEQYIGKEDIKAVRLCKTIDNWNTPAKCQEIPFVYSQASYVFTFAKTVDFNGDGKLNIADIGLILSQYTALSVPVTDLNRKYDINSDNIINISDIALVLSKYTQLEVIL